MISNEISLSRANKAPSYAQTNQLSSKKAFYDRVKSQFLQQSAEYLGSTLSHQEMKAFLDQKSYVRN